MVADTTLVHTSQDELRPARRPSRGARARPLPHWGGICFTLASTSTLAASASKCWPTGRSRPSVFAPSRRHRRRGRPPRGGARTPLASAPAVRSDAHVTPGVCDPSPSTPGVNPRTIQRTPKREAARRDPPRRMASTPAWHPKLCALRKERRRCKHACKMGLQSGKLGRPSWHDASTCKKPNNTRYSTPTCFREAVSLAGSGAFSPNEDLRPHQQTTTNKQTLSTATINGGGALSAEGPQRPRETPPKRHPTRAAPTQVVGPSNYQQMDRLPCAPRARSNASTTPKRCCNDIGWRRWRGEKQA